MTVFSSVASNNKAESRFVNRSIGEMRVTETFTYCTARSYDHLHTKALY